MIAEQITPLFRVSNYIEAGLWISIGIGFAIAAVGAAVGVRRRCWIAAVTFILFGISDLVESRTGAWYRPMGLLIWKGACVVVLAVLMVLYFRDRRLPR
jgi:hypothetical protein